MSQYDISMFERDRDRLLNDPRKGNTTKYEEETCKPGRLGVPEPDATTKWLWWLLEFIVKAYAAIILVFLCLHLSGDWVQSLTHIKWEVLSLALVYGVNWILTLLGSFMHCSNAMARKSGRSEAPLMCNWPTIRFGLTYLSVLLTGFCVVTTYMWLFLRDTPDLISEDEHRGFRAKLWMMVGLILLDLLYTLVDYMQLAHAWMTYSNKAGTSVDFCGDAHDPTVYHKHGDMSMAITLNQLGSWATYFAAFAGVLYLAEELYLGNLTRAWAPAHWRMFNGVVAIVLGVIVLCHFAALFITYNHACMYRKARMATLYWLSMFFWVGTMWYYMQVFIHDDHRDGLTTSRDRQEWENYKWISLFAYGFHLFMCMWHVFHCYIAQDMRRAWCPHFPGL